MKPNTLDLSHIKIDESGNENISGFILNGLRAYSAPCLGTDKSKDFSLSITGPNSKIIAGIFGATRQYPQSKIVWIYGVWVDTAYRGQGLGTKLFEGLNIFALSKNCTTIQLEIFDFQGKLFYEKQGFQSVGMIPNALAGRDKYFMRKIPTPPPSPIDLSPIFLDESGNERIKQAIRNGLNDFNTLYFNDCPEKKFSIYLPHDTSKIIGGILGNINRQRAWANVVWVDEEHRGQSIGTLLWKKLEGYVRDNKCSLIFVGTLDFHAKPFYEKLGCKCQITLPKWIDRYDQHWLEKNALL